MEHFAYLKRKRRAAAAADVLTARGFKVSISRTGLSTALRAERPNSLNDQDVRHFLDEVVTVVESNGGEYEGWGALTAD